MIAGIRPRLKFQIGWVEFKPQGRLDLLAGKVAAEPDVVVDSIGEQYLRAKEFVQRRPDAFSQRQLKMLQVGLWVRDPPHLPAYLTYHTVLTCIR